MQLLMLQRPLRGWFFLFLVVNLADLISTFLILQHGMVKDNLPAAFLLHHVGVTLIMIIKVALIALASFVVQSIAKRSPDACELACNLLICLSGIALILFTANTAACAITYF